MLTLKQINEDKDRVIAGLNKKHFPNAEEAINKVLQFDAQRKSAQQLKDNAQAEMNRLSKEIGNLFKQGKVAEAADAKAKTTQLKENITQFEAQMKEAEDAQTALLLTIPNVPYDIVPEGTAAEDNLVVKSNVGECPEGSTVGNWQGNVVNDQAKLPHWELAKKYNLIDFDLGVKISGAGFPVYIGKGAQLQRALINFFLAEAAKAG